MAADLHAMPFRGERLRDLAEMEGLSMRDLAAALGTTQSRVSKIVNGRSRLTPEIIEADGVYLMGDNDTPKSARDAARNEAMRAATEQAGVYIESTSEVQGYALTRDEIPHAVAVDIEEMTTRQKGDVYIRAVIYVERESQKGIVIGTKGALLRTIGAQARTDVETLLGSKVYLDLWVKTRKDWRNRATALREFGFYETD